MGVGPVLIVEPVPGAVTAAVGLWVRRGSGHEPDALAGVTHLLEHLLLRRCGTRTPPAIARLIDSLGGAVDAYTTRETCAVTAHVPASRFTDALNLVIDAVFRPVVRDRELAVEQAVVAAEFDLVQDSPAEVAAERALHACWGAHPLARPVLGSREVVARLTADQVLAFHERTFIPANVVLVAVGPTSEEALASRLPVTVAEGTEEPALPPVSWRSEVVLDERAGLEQVYANLVMPGFPSGHQDSFALGLLHQLLGGGTSSRLFRELRERRGLVYEVESAVFSTSVAGVLEVTCSTPVRHIRSCLDAVVEVLERVAGGGISDREVELARQALMSSLVLGSEGCDSRLEAYAGEWLTRGFRYDPRRLAGELAAVTPEQVRDVAARVVQVSQLAGALCGPAEGLLVSPWLARKVA
jgi:predicted Zn-dependent peptidase